MIFRQAHFFPMCPSPEKCCLRRPACAQDVLVWEAMMTLPWQSQFTYKYVMVEEAEDGSGKVGAGYVHAPPTVWCMCDHHTPDFVVRLYNHQGRQEGALVLLGGGRNGRQKAAMSILGCVLQMQRR